MAPARVVLLTKAIELAGGVAEFHVPHRLKDGYGMRPEVVEAAAEQGVKLIVSVDTGIRAAEVVTRANELGIDVIVTDHHLPEAELPPALAVLNPNRPGLRVSGEESLRRGRGVQAGAGAAGRDSAGRRTKSGASANRSSSWWRSRPSPTWCR